MNLFLSGWSVEIPELVSGCVQEIECGIVTIGDAMCGWMVSQLGGRFRSVVGESVFGLSSGFVEDVGGIVRSDSGVAFLACASVV